MPRNSGGIYSLPPVYLATPGETIMTEQHNPPLEDIANGITESLPRSGSAPMTGDLKMGGQKITGLGAPVADTDAARKVDINIPAASETVAGKVELATDAETITGTDTTRAVHPAGLKALIDATVPAASETVAGKVELATEAEAVAGTDDTKALTPLSGKAMVDARALGVGQSWVNVKASRVLGTAYQNTTARPMLLSITVKQDGTSIWVFEISDDGAVWSEFTRNDLGSVMTVFCLITPNGYYRARALAGSPTIFNFWEFR